MSDPQTRPLWKDMADCPFCAAKASEFHISVGYATDMSGKIRSFMGECDECAAMGPSDPDEFNAMRMWNARLA